ncbi:hypothetical protein SAMN02745724_03497 [Pseudoalteromonas denitrificans DSM 6059]|uniref:Uncharacterized protein n=1 Tax=Pseudoalteromonas denitrificans DSM 6059 TaxID=1123010 RepID=A0A1I1PKP1_9GAMM|nr:hypothetical protein [Pseudoalteromonas denitrificans]SFD10217.1 hypothetical protein SAMN02745724_03497 [Pseudoalteromonas denitrificans DSM 6059]
MLQQSHALTKALGLQYIATINEDQLLTLRNTLSDGEYEEIFEKITLELKGDSPEPKLVGIQIDMQ